MPRYTASSWNATCITVRSGPISQIFPTGRMEAYNEMQAAISYSSIGPVHFTSTGAAKMRSVGIPAGLKAKYPEVPRPLGT